MAKEGRDNFTKYLLDSKEIETAYYTLKMQWSLRFDNKCEDPSLSKSDARMYGVSQSSMLSAIMSMYLDIKTGEINYGKDKS